ncbi:MAG: glycosyltransferase family 2 protein [Nitrospirota bacterium]
MAAHIPLISAVVPCRNENTHIESCVRSLLMQKTALFELELLVVDGMSDDGTRDILKRLIQSNSNLRMLDNPGRSTPAALNIGIQAGRGEYIAILGAHAEYGPNYLETCLKLLNEHPEVCCAGGPIISRGKGLFGRAVASAMSHPLGIGNAKHRLPGYEGYAEGACFPMFRRRVFTDVGLFDERMVYVEDDELNYRLAKRNEKVFISPRAECAYFVRETPSRLAQQYFRYGAARVAVLRKYRMPASMRQLVPPVFIGLLLIGLVVGPWLPGWWRILTVVLPGLYMVALISAAIGQIQASGIQVAARFPFAVATMHACYALGFVSASFKGYPSFAPATDRQRSPTAGSG